MLSGRFPCRMRIATLPSSKLRWVTISVPRGFLSMSARGGTLGKQLLQEWPTSWKYELPRTPLRRSSRRRESLHSPAPDGPGDAGEVGTLQRALCFLCTASRGAYLYIRKMRAGGGLGHRGGPMGGKAKGRSPVGPWPVNGKRWAG